MSDDLIELKFEEVDSQENKTEARKIPFLAPSGVKKVFHESNGALVMADQSSVQVTYDQLPPGNYTIAVDQKGNWWFQPTRPFSLPSKLYGETEQQAKRILTTFLDRETGTTGVLLSGLKGSGKTLLSKVVCSMMAEILGMPTLIINEPYSGDAFMSMLRALPQRVIILFDEFEKVYNKPEWQESILTLLDGTLSGGHLVIFTCNDQYKINTHMINRPGRVYYSLRFGSLTREFIREYAEDKLENKEHLQGVITLGTIINDFNFDMLQALIQEMNRYKETAQEVCKYLNVKIESVKTAFSVELHCDGAAVPEEAINPSYRVMNLIPLRGFSVDVSNDGKTDFRKLRNGEIDDENLYTIDVCFREADLKDITDEGKFVFETYQSDHYWKVVLSRKEPEYPSYSRYLA